MTVYSCTSLSDDKYVIVDYFTTRVTYSVDFLGMLSQGFVPRGTKFSAIKKTPLDNSGDPLVARVMNILFQTFENIRRVAIKLEWGPMGNNVICISNFIQKIKEANGCTSLDLKGCGLNLLPSQICLLKNLEQLDLSNNDLRVLPIHLQGLTALKMLDLRGNPIVELPDWLEREGLEILHDLPRPSPSQFAQDDD